MDFLIKKYVNFREIQGHDGDDWKKIEIEKNPGESTPKNSMPSTWEIQILEKPISKPIKCPSVITFHSIAVRQS